MPEISPLSAEEKPRLIKVPCGINALCIAQNNHIQVLIGK
uniref:Transcriptional regulator n=1 Tax=Ascaris lumbricoides TaxID=6252 RepID=A0A0M3ICP3_ASCLU